MRNSTKVMTWSSVLWKMDLRPSKAYSYLEKIFSFVGLSHIRIMMSSYVSLLLLKSHWFTKDGSVRLVGCLAEFIWLVQVVRWNLCISQRSLCGTTPDLVNIHVLFSVYLLTVQCFNIFTYTVIFS